MRTFKLLAVTAGAFMLFVSDSVFAQCSDDERMYSIGSFIDAQRSGGTEPLQITAETFLQLTPNAREAIGDNVNILDENCRPMQVFRGEPAARIEAPFPLIYNAFYDAVLRGDTQTQGVVLRSFKAAPADPMEFLSLLSPISVDVTIARQFASAAGISLSQARISGTRNNQNNLCEEGEPLYITYADVFNRFGGQVQGRHGVAWFAITDEDVAAVDYRQASNIYMQGRCRSSRGDMASRIRGAGAVVIDVEEISWLESSYPTKKVIEHYEQWVKDGSPNSVPQSLFD